MEDIKNEIKLKKRLDDINYNDYSILCFDVFNDELPTLEEWNKYKTIIIDDILPDNYILSEDEEIRYKKYKEFELLR